MVSHANRAVKFNRFAAQFDRHVVLVQFFERRETEPIFNFPLYGKHRFPYLWNHGLWVGDIRCVELSFFDFVCQLDSAQCYFRIPESLESQHRIISLLHPPMILLNHVIQVLAGPDEHLCPLGFAEN